MSSHSFLVTSVVLPFSLNMFMQWRIFFCLPAQNFSFPLRSFFRFQIWCSLSRQHIDNLFNRWISCIILVPLIFRSHNIIGTLLGDLDKFLLFLNVSWFVVTAWNTRGCGLFTLFLKLSLFFYWILWLSVRHAFLVWTVNEARNVNCRKEMKLDSFSS